MKPSSRQTNVTALDNWEMENSATSSVFERQEVYKKKTNKNKKNKNETFTYQEKHGVSQLCAKAYSKLAGS